MQKFIEAVDEIINHAYGADQSKANTEFIKLITSDNPDEIIITLVNNGYLEKYGLPEIGKMRDVVQSKYHHLKVLDHSLLVLRQTPPNIISRIGALLHDVGKPACWSASPQKGIQFIGHEIDGAKLAELKLKALGFEDNIVDGVSTVVRLHMDCHRVNSDKALRKWVEKAGPYLENLLQVCEADSLSHHPDHCDPDRIPLIRKRIKELPIKVKKENVITGNDLRSFFKPSAKYKGLLEYAHKFHAENPTISKEQLLEEVVSFGKKEQCEPNDNYEPHKKKLVKILRGIPGSGKSYYARTVKDATIISTDNYFISDGVYTFDKSKLGEAHKSTFKGFVSLIINPEFSGTIIIDNTNITIAEIAPYYSVAAAYDWDVEIITFDTPFRMCVDRQTHGVSMQTMQQRSSLMHKEDNNFPAYWKKRRIITVDTQLTSDQEIALKVLDTLNGDGCGGGRSRTCTPDIEQHTCPYREEIHNDNFTLCRCCDTCSHECAMDI